MAKSSKKRTAAIVVSSFFTFAAIIYYLANQQFVTPAMGGLMLIALFGLYVGFGILIAVYRLINRLQ